MGFGVPAAEPVHYDGVPTPVQAPQPAPATLPPVRLPSPPQPVPAGR